MNTTRLAVRASLLAAVAAALALFFTVGLRKVPVEQRAAPAAAPAQR